MRARSPGDKPTIDRPTAYTLIFGKYFLSAAFSASIFLKKILLFKSRVLNKKTWLTYGQP